MSPPDPAAELLLRASQLTDRYQAGGPKSFESFLDLVQLLLVTTVMKDGGAGVRLDIPTRRKPEGRTRILGRAGGEAGLVPLRDGRWLKLVIVLFVDPADGQA